MQKYRKFFLKNLLTLMLLASLSVVSVQYMLVAEVDFIRKGVVLTKKTLPALIAEHESESESSETETKIEVEDELGMADRPSLPSTNGISSTITFGHRINQYASVSQPIATPPPQVASVFV
jgi:hypothetical protein